MRCAHATCSRSGKEEVVEFIVTALCRPRPGPEPSLPREPPREPGGHRRPRLFPARPGWKPGSSSGTSLEPVAQPNVTWHK